MRSVMTHQFSQIPRIQIPRSVFDRSHGYKTTFNEDHLIPFLVDEALPGDTFNVQATLFARLATPIVPIMDNMYLDTFYFAVPNRLLWDHWVNFQGEVVDPNTTTISYINPTLATLTVAEGDISDYFGLPIHKTFPSGKINSLPYRAYNKVYNQWFRDENLITPASELQGDGPDNPSLFALRTRGKRHDYFTSALPWPQKGPGVMIPLGSTAPVYGNGSTLGLSLTGADAATRWGLFVDSPLSANVLGITTSESAHQLPHTATVGGTPGTLPGVGVINDGSKSGLIADLSTATAATINSLRQAFQLQRLYERDARGGTRYVESIKAHFGVISPDFRLQRPEYLGGSSQMINITPVAQTSVTPATGTGNATPQGNLAAYGLASSKSGFHHSFTEHCIIIGILNVRADLTYQQGLNRMWSRKYREDYYMPVLAHLGEQEVYTKEIYADGSSNDDIIFGYQERFAEYRYFPSLITGQMRTDLTIPANSLDVWHLSQSFGSRPTLGQAFIESDTPVSRCIAVQSEPHFILDSYIQMKCARPMPVYSVPGLIDHF